MAIIGLLGGTAPLPGNIEWEASMPGWSKATRVVFGYEFLRRIVMATE